VERAAWTSERLDDLAEGMRTGFARVDQSFARVDQSFARVDQDVRDLRTEMREEFRALHSLLYRTGGGIIVTLIGVIAAILARGV
jgi:3-dehydroquinate synthetase